MPASVQISISCLVFKAPIIIEPVLKVTPPALLMAVGVQSTADSLSLHRT